MRGREEAEAKIQNMIETEMLPELPTFITEWYYRLKGKGLTMKTCRSYLYTASLFFKSTGLPLDSKISDIQPSMITKYFGDIQYKVSESGERIRTSESYRKATYFELNDLFNYHLMVGNISRNHMSLVEPKKKRIEDNVKRYHLTADDFRAILEEANISGNSEFLKVRNKAILAVFLSTGMRRSALCQINVEDVDIKNAKLYAIDKGEKPFTYKLTESVLNALMDWIYVRNSVYCKTDALFVSRTGMRMDGSNVFDVVKQSTQNALGYSISPHKLRAACCTALYEETHNIKLVSKRLKHGSIKTTERYVVDNDDDEEKAADILEQYMNATTG